MLTNEAKRKLTSTAMFAMPVALVWVVSMMLGGPDSARAEQSVPVATTALPGPGEVPDSARSNSEAQVLALARIEQLRGESFGPSPLHHQTVGGPAIVIDAGPNERSEPSFAVKAIMDSKGGNTALIEGHVYRVGDWFGDTGWRITDIDVESRSVVIEDPDTGRLVIRKVRGPGE